MQVLFLRRWAHRHVSEEINIIIRLSSLQKINTKIRLISLCLSLFLCLCLSLCASLCSLSPPERTSAGARLKRVPVGSRYSTSLISTYSLSNWNEMLNTHTLSLSPHTHTQCFCEQRTRNPPAVLREYVGAPAAGSLSAPSAPVSVLSY